jgi:histidinol-phosphate aminotransferase
MTTSKLSRREFAVSMGVAAAAAAARPTMAFPAMQRPARAARPAGAILLNANENSYGPSPKALEAMTGSQSIAMRYPDAAYGALQKQVADLHGVSDEQILFGCGSVEILRVTDAAFLAPDKNIVAAEPTFEAVLEYAKVTRSPAIKVPMTAEFRHDLPAMAAQCTSRTGVVYVCNPNNPTGTIVGSDEMARFFEAVPKSTLILVDEAYHHFVEDPRYASATAWIGKMPNLIVARTFSKVYGLAGMRLGYAVGSKEAIERMRPYSTVDNGNAAVLAAASVSLQDAGYVADCRKRIVDSRRWVTEQLRALNFRVTDSQANFFMTDVRGDVTPLIEEFRTRNVYVGRKFPSMASWMRVSIGTSDEMRAFMEAFREIMCPAGKCAVAG